MKRYIKNKLHLLSAIISVLWFRYPSRQLKVIGITGTDGKTTTANILYHILQTAEIKTVLISTTGMKMTGRSMPLKSHVTTPSPWFIQKALRKAVDDGYSHAVVEMTSHGIDQYRTFGTNVKIGVVTNLTHEHLDYHKSMKDYALAKAKMFNSAKFAIVSKSENEYPIQDYLNTKIKLIDYLGTQIPVKIKVAVKKRFPEKFNQKNAYAAYFVAELLNIPEKKIVSAIRTFSNVDGRLNEIKNKRGFRVFVDFAHTPNALKNLLSYLNSQKHNRLVVVFGAAGERDKGKRPTMGKIASKYADVIILTCEDNRSENVKTINSEIREGISKKYKGVVLEEVDRKKAVVLAIKTIARIGDIVVFCGKGHEKSINIDGTEFPWDEKRYVTKCLT